jgi:recombination protein RecA
MKPKKEKVEKKQDETLANTIRDIRKQFGEDSIMMLNEKPHSDVEAISTGSMGLDQALGIGGMPRGRVVEIYGAESSGKTTLALHLISETQKKGGICAFVDAEHALDPQYAQKIGVQTDKLLISQPNGGEEALNIVESLVRSKKIDTIVIDSVAALTPKAELEGQIGAMQIGAQARLMSQALRILTAGIAKSNTLVVFINQTRVNIGGYGDPVTTAGGKALKFYSSVRVEIKKIATIKKGEEAMGNRVRAKVVKNKVAAPFKVTEFDIVYNEGISKEGEILALGEKHGLIKKDGNSYKYNGETMGRGYESSRDFLRKNDLVAKELIAKIIEITNES